MSNTVFVGLSPKAVADRVELVEPKIIFAQDYSVQEIWMLSGISPIAVFAGLELVKTLPKTRSGKIMRRALKRVWTGEALEDISTIEDEASIEEVKKAASMMKILREEG
jgi:acyl-coenzyme A synthetase/AMP-(fatty) acid ligase